MCRRKLIILLILILSFNLSRAQSVWLGSFVTGSSYFGDLAPFDIKQSFSQIHKGYGLYVSKELYEGAFFSFVFEHAVISGDDKQSAAESRRIRNLNFQSPLDCASLMLGYRISPFRSNAIGVKVATGLTIFKFDPQTVLDGHLIRLQPLSTEGQGLPGGPKPYALINYSIPIQAGLYYRIYQNIFLETSFTFYFANTDYLDDVSTSYYDSETLRQLKGEIAVRVADRHIGIETGQGNYPSGQIRGNPKRNDQFGFIKLGVSMNLGEKNSGSYRSKVKCPVLGKSHIF